MHISLSWHPLAIFQTALACLWPFYQMVQLFLYRCSEPASVFLWRRRAALLNSLSAPRLSKCRCPLISPRPGKQPCHQDRCEESCKAINPANLLEGWLLSACCCFTFPSSLPNKPCMASLCFLTVCLGGQQNKTEQEDAMVGGFLFVFSFPFFKKRDTNASLVQPSPM